MHEAAMSFVAEHAPKGPVDVLDVGGRDVNGSPRHLFDATTYEVIDLFDAPGVDVVGDITTLGLTDHADLVLCLEVLEHAPDWPAVLAACVTACRPGGRVIMTAAGPTREAHSAHDGGHLRDGEHYANVGRSALLVALDSFGGIDSAMVDELGDDIRCVIDKAKP